MGTVYVPVAPTHPHRDAGTALLVFGILMFVGGILAATYCNLSFFGVCLSHPYAGAGGALAGLGFILLIIGIVLMVVTGPSAPAPAPVVYAQPQPVYYVPIPPPPPPPAPADRFCESCGARNARTSAFCDSCGKPLPPPP